MINIMLVVFLFVAAIGGLFVGFCYAVRHSADEGLKSELTKDNWRKE